VDVRGRGFEPARHTSVGEMTVAKALEKVTKQYSPRQKNGKKATRPAATPPARPDLPAILIDDTQLTDLPAKALRALAQGNDPPSVFVRTGAPSRVVRDENGLPKIEPFDRVRMRCRLTEAANFFTLRKGENGYEPVGTHPPLSLAGHVPLAIVDAPVQGTGKTLLVATLGTIAVGSVATESIPSKQNDDEWRKKITSILLAAGPFVLLDNIPDMITETTRGKTADNGTIVPRSGVCTRRVQPRAHAMDSRLRAAARAAVHGCPLVTGEPSELLSCQEVILHKGRLACPKCRVT